MKMVKSLLLGSAAGIVAVAGAQAADLPVKAKPVEYVKVCSLYGAGFYYMPGTDICIKLGGYVRAQYYAWNSYTGTVNTFQGGAQFDNRNAALNQDAILRVRAVLTIDTRQQTEYGTLRTYTLMGYNHDAAAPGVSIYGASAGLYVNRGFIQLAGFTFGKAQSFYDIFSNPAITYFGIPGSDTGDAGVNLAAYTAQFGNGFSGTVSVEAPRRTSIYSSNSATIGGVFTAGAAGTFGFGSTYTNTNAYGNVNAPDIVGALRLDQAWGSAQVMAAAHQVRTSYYGGGAAPQAIANGHPDDKWGWVAGVGAIINTPFISPGDKFQFQFNYTQGATNYLSTTEPGNYAKFGGSSLGWGLMTDAVMFGPGTSVVGPYSAGPGIELTKGWNLNASYEHVWNQKWKTSVYGGIVQIDYGDGASLVICGAALTARGCTADWSQWWVGSRTQFNINSSTYMGLDVMYTKLNTAWAGGDTGVQIAPGGGLPTNIYSFKDQDNLGVTFRIHRDFLP